MRDLLSSTSTSHVTVRDFYLKLTHYGRTKRDIYKNMLFIMSFKIKNRPRPTRQWKTSVQNTTSVHYSLNLIISWRCCHMTLRRPIRPWIAVLGVPGAQRPGCRAVCLGEGPTAPDVSHLGHRIPRSAISPLEFWRVVRLTLGFQRCHIHHWQRLRHLVPLLWRRVFIALS